MSNTNPIRKPLSRRTLLRGTVAGVGVSVALPWLEALTSSVKPAHGDGTFPKRFGVFFFGNGVIAEQWVPAVEGPAWALSSLMQPLMPIKQHLTVVSGTRVNTLNTVPHGSGPAGLFSGDSLGGSEFNQGSAFRQPTIDQLIANVIGGETRFRSLETGVQNAEFGISHSGPNQRLPIEANPRSLFNRLFGEGFRAPGEMGMLDPRIGLRRSVLDAVTGQNRRLASQVSAEDRRRLDAHLSSVRTIEQQLARLEQNPPNLAACMRPAQPPELIPDIMGRPDLRLKSSIMADLLAMSLACDMTRTFFHNYSVPVNNLLFPNARAGHHQLTHDEGGSQPQVGAILQLIMADFAAFVQALARLNEGGESVLDHTLLLCTTDCSLGRTHALDEYPLLFAGGRSHGLVRGTHLRARGENICKVSLSIMQMMGLRNAEFGIGAGRVTEPLPGLLA